MNFTIVYSPRAEHQHNHAVAMREGLRRHGIGATLVQAHEAVRTDDVACWGWRRGVGHHARGRRVLVMERGYIGDRFAWSSVAWNGLNGRARFGARCDGGERFEVHFGRLMQPWAPRGDYVLLIGQVPGDAALQGRCLQAWYAEQARRAAALYGLPVWFRPHPLSWRRGAQPVIAGAPRMDGDLALAIRDAALVVTFNSNTAVEALLAGKPTVAMDEGSMTTGVALSDLPATLDVPEPDRGAWARALAWKQFTMDEIRSGFAWEVAASARQ